MKNTIKSKWSYLILMLLFATALSIIDGAISIYMMKVVDTAIAGDRIEFFNQTKTMLLFAALLLPVNMLLAISKGLFKYKTLASAKIEFMNKVFKKNISEFQRDNNSIYISALTNDINTIDNNYLEAIYQIVQSLTMIVVGIWVIYTVSTMVLLIGIGVSLLSTLMVMGISKPLQKQQHGRSNLFDGYTSYIKEFLSAFSIIKANDLEEKVRNDYFHKSKDIQQKGYIIDKLLTYFLSFQHFTVHLSFFGIGIIAAYMSIKGSITVGGVILIINNIEKIIYPLNQAAEWLPKIFSVKPLFNKMDEMLQNKTKIDETIDIESFKSEIELENVSFGYDDELVLRDVNLNIKKGYKYLVIGPSGGGKSTLLKLLRKYFNPVTGIITIDNVDLRNVTKKSYFRNIANVEQQVFLFEDTLRNNITLYKEYSDDEIELAITRAGLMGFVNNLKDGLDTLLYDNGKNVSGGEKSRIAIARGLLAKTDIIFLDEAFASLDSKVAKDIEKTILTLDGVTVVNVSHVIFDETKDKYNQIVTVANGRIH